MRTPGGKRRARMSRARWKVALNDGVRRLSGGEVKERR